MATASRTDATVMPPILSPDAPQIIAPNTNPKNERITPCSSLPSNDSATWLIARFASYQSAGLIYIFPIVPFPSFNFLLIASTFANVAFICAHIRQRINHLVQLLLVLPKRLLDLVPCLPKIVKTPNVPAPQSRRYKSNGSVSHSHP